MHCHKTDQGEAERSDDLLVCRLCYESSSTANLELQHRVSEAFFYAALAYAEASCDFFGGKSSSNLEKALQFARRQASAEVAYPCADSDRVHF